MDSFIPKIEHLIEKLFHNLFSRKKLESFQFHEMNKAEVNLFRREKLCRQDYLDYLKNKAKSGDMAVLELTFRKMSLGKWVESGPKIDPATGVKSTFSLGEST